METLIFENKCSKVYYNDSLQLGKIVWNGQPDEITYKEPFWKLIEHAAKVPVPNFLSDTTNQGVVNPENRKWFEKQMFPAAMKAGLKRAAVISNANVFKQYYINMILSSTNKFGLPVKIFSKEEDALKWFENFDQ